MTVRRDLHLRTNECQEYEREVNRFKEQIKSFEFELETKEKSLRQSADTMKRVKEQLETYKNEIRDLGLKQEELEKAILEREDRIEELEMKGEGSTDVEMLREQFKELEKKKNDKISKLLDERETLQNRIDLLETTKDYELSIKQN